jgi:tryptophan synthase alpha chain
MSLACNAVQCKRRELLLGVNLLPSDMSAGSSNSSRISRRFAELRETGEMGIVAYITAGDPSFAATLKFVVAMAAEGADVIELGVPFSDPLADGPTIQRASERALKNGATLGGVIDLVSEIRKTNSPANEVPIVLFSYYNPVFQMGLEKFAAAASAAGADGVLITDLTPEESADYRRIMAQHHLDTVFLGAPTSTDERLEKIAACSSGFLYLISRTGVTGARDSLADELPALLRRARNVTQLPIAVGFGISLPGHVSVLGGLADAAVVGSALVSEVEKATAQNSAEAGIHAAAAALADRIRSLKSAARIGLSRREVTT